MEEGEQHKPGGITLEEQQSLPKIVFGENPDLSKEQKTYHKEQMHIDSSIPEYRSLEDIVRDRSSTNAQALLKNIGKSQYKIQQLKGVNALLSPSEIYVRSPIDRPTEGSYSRDDMSKLANMYCFVLTGGKHLEYSEELTKDDIVHPDVYEALDLMKSMVLNEEVPSIEDVHQHPFHWNEHQKLYFLCKTYGYTLKLQNKTLDKFIMSDTDIVPENWIKRLELTREDMRRILCQQQRVSCTKSKNYFSKKYTKSDRNSLFHILKFIRDRYVYYYEDPKAGKQTYSSRPVEYWKLISSRFPRLFMHFYHIMKHNLLQDEDIKQCLATEYQPKLYQMKLLSETKHSFELTETPIAEQADAGIDTDTDLQDDKLKSGGFDASLYASSYMTDKSLIGGGFDTSSLHASSYMTDKSHFAKKYPFIIDKFRDTSSIPSNFEENKEREGTEKLYPASHKENEHPTLEDDWYFDEEFDDNQIVTSKFIDVLDLDHRLLRRHRNTTIRFKIPITKKVDNTASIQTTSSQNNLVSKEHAIQGQDVNTDTHSQADEESTATTNLREIQDDATGSSSIPCVTSVGGLQTLNIFDCALEEQDLTTIENRLENEEPSVIKFTNCSGKFSDDDDDDVTTKKDYKVEKLTFSFNKNFKELWRLFLFVLNRCCVKSLCLMYNNIDDDDIEKLARVLKDRRITGLDVSYNKNITARGFNDIGIIARENELTALKAIDCKLEPDKLFKLLQGLGDHKLNELDVSRNKELTTDGNREPITKGIETIGEFVANKGVETLKLAGCRLTEKHMKAFQEQLKDTKEEGLLQELDVGYNPTLESASYSILGECLSVCGVSRLHLRGNKIGESHLKSLNTCVKKHQIKFLNVGDNFHLCNGLAELADIVREYQLQKLFMNDCKFTVGDLENFRECLKGFKLQQISFIDRYRERNTEYLNEVKLYRESVTA